MDADTIDELADLVTAISRRPDLKYMVFDSANPDRRRPEAAARIAFLLERGLLALDGAERDLGRRGEYRPATEAA